VFVEDLAAPALAAADAHHLTRVLRLRDGAPLTVADGRGSWRPARLAGHSVDPTSEPVRWTPPRPALTVAFALTKGDKPELVVQKLTELGVDRIVPLRAARSVVRWDDDKAAKALDRLRSVARSAAMQCHRPDLPEVGDVVELAALAGGSGVAMADRRGAPPSLDHTTVVVGPEGGWADEERALGLPSVALGDHVLRAETAAIAVGVLWTALRSERDR
jgi:16S rRNA (uracil1498-N3)-methyltransferase